MSWVWVATSSLAAITPCALCGGSALLPDVQAGYHCVDDRNEEMGNSNGMWDGSGYGLATEEACTASFGVWAAYTCKFVSDQYTFLDTADYACSSVQIMCALVATPLSHSHPTCPIHTPCLARVRSWSQFLPTNNAGGCCAKQISAPSPPPPPPPHPPGPPPESPPACIDDDARVAALSLSSEGGGGWSCLEAAADSQLSLGDTLAARCNASLRGVWSEAEEGEMLGGFSGACCAECSRTVPSLVRPRLTSVHFTRELDRMIVAFDAATSMPAGCPLDAATRASLGDATCFWSDATTLVVAMSGSSAIRGGDTVQVAPGAVWPSGYTGARCEEVHVCSDVASAWTLSAALPCDDLRTNTTVELCALPTAEMVVPSLSACPGSTLLLDGAYSSAGLSSPSYVRRLSHFCTFAPRVLPRTAALSSHHRRRP